MREVKLIRYDFDGHQFFTTKEQIASTEEILGFYVSSSDSHIHPIKRNSSYGEVFIKYISELPKTNPLTELKQLRQEVEELTRYNDNWRTLYYQLRDEINAMKEGDEA